MKKIKLLITLVLLSIVFINVIPASANSDEVYAGSISSPNTVYTLSETEYDEETGKLAYQKISYSKNTYNSMVITESDASGAPIEVSNDAQYVFFPARYSNISDSTQVSFKFNNTGVEKIYLHAEYYAGVSEGGIDYEPGIKFVCMNMIATSEAEAWNVKLSKSQDGYDVTTITFGLYAKTIYDFTLTGFRLYFDYGNTVTSERSFEVLGYEVHENNQVPTFTTDPKPTRLSKLTSDDVTIRSNTFTVDSTATVNAKIYDYTPENYKLNIAFNLSDVANVEFKLDDEIVSSKNYSKGNHEIQLELTKENYSKFAMKVTGTNVVVKIKEVKFHSPSFVDKLSGSGYEITEIDGITTAKFTHQKSWHSLDGVVRNYNKDYQYLKFKFNLAQDTVVGVYIDGSSLKYHTATLAGDHEWLLDISSYEMEEATIKIYLDPGDSVAGTVEKTITINELKLLKADDLPKAQIVVDELFEFDYDGNTHGVSGVTVTPALKLTYEYKQENASDEDYSQELPVDAGTYIARISTPFTNNETGVYGKTYAYSKVVINKASVDKPAVNAIGIDYANNKVTYDPKVFVVALDENYTNIVKNGGYITFGNNLYFKYIESNNYSESETTKVELNQKEESFNVSINYLDETTVESIPTTVEYSTDGLKWISGNNNTVKLVPEMIYIFRTKATSSSFASDKVYLATPSRPEIGLTLEIESTKMQSVKVKAVEGAEYRLGNGEWQDSNEFTGLVAGQYVEIYMRIKSSETSFASKEIGVRMLPGAISSAKPIVKSDTILETEVEDETDYEEVPSISENEVLPENTYVVTNFAELKQATNNLSSKFVTYIIIRGTIVLESDIKLNGKVVLTGEESAEIVFEKGNSKTTLSNDKNNEIRFENIKFTRTVTSATEEFLFYINAKTSVWFVECEFDVAIHQGGANLSYDRVTYVPSGKDVSFYFDNCIYNTEAYFYRGTMYFYNSNAELPVTGGDAVVADFTDFKIDYLNKTLTFPSRKYKVSEDEEFSELLASETEFKSNTTYYITDGTYTFSYTTKDLKLATPTLNDVNIDYVNEKISFGSQYIVSKNAEFTELLKSGDSVTPGMKLYIKEIATGIFIDSDVLEATLPERPEVIELESEFECSFGFVMEYYPNAEYKIDGEYQYSPVFIGLESGKTYTVTIRLGATDNSFASNTYQVQVTLTN